MHIYISSSKRVSYHSHFWLANLLLTKHLKLLQLRNFKISKSVPGISVATLSTYLNSSDLFML